MTSFPMRSSAKLFLPALILLAPFTVANAQTPVTSNWVAATTSGVWSNASNWGVNGVPNNNNDIAQSGTNLSREITVDDNFTIKQFVVTHSAATSVAGTVTTLSGSGVLTIDVNAGTGSPTAMNVATANTNTTLRIDGSVTINNAAFPTYKSYFISGGSSNTTQFSSGSTLTLNTPLHVNGPGTARFNGSILGSSELTIGTAPTIFGTGHNSSGFNSDIILAASSKLTIDAGTVLNTGRKFQVNGTGAEIELNGANVINGANLNVGGTNNFLLDVNANQANFGLLADIGGTLTIELDPAVTALSFLNSSASEANWTGGAVTIVGFRENVIRFGMDVTGLTSTQLSLFTGGTYSLTDTGYLTAIPEPAFFAGLAGLLGLGVAQARRRRG